VKLRLHARCLKHVAQAHQSQMHLHEAQSVQSKDPAPDNLFRALASLKEAEEPSKTIYAFCGRAPKRMIQGLEGDGLSAKLEGGWEVAVQDLAIKSTSQVRVNGGPVRSFPLRCGVGRDFSAHCSIYR
jgi:hypothetical protein